MDWRKEMMELMESRDAVRRAGLRERARPESTPMTSRLRIFSLTWVGRSGSGREKSANWMALGAGFFRVDDGLADDGFDNWGVVVLLLVVGSQYADEDEDEDEAQRLVLRTGMSLREQEEGRQHSENPRDLIP